MTFVIWCYIFAWLEKQMKIFHAFEMENIRPNMFGLINILKPWKNSHFNCYLLFEAEYNNVHRW